MLRNSLWITLLLWGMLSYAQTLDGRVQSEDGSPVEFAQIAYLDGKGFAESRTDGTFSLPLRTNATLVVGKIGFLTDTLTTTSNTSTLLIVLKSSGLLEQVDLSETVSSATVITTETRKVEQMNREEFAKAACCNVSESFETTPSVDVSFGNAVSGKRQIQLLGLSSVYTQYTEENMPILPGVFGNNGLNLIPGTWLDQLQLTKGIGSVIYGYESISGQVNLNMIPPLQPEKLFVNAYGNQAGRAEVNLHGYHSFSDSLSTSLYLHYKNNSNPMDRNADNFLDMPLTKTFAGLHRWKWIGKNNWRAQANAQVFLHEINGGNTPILGENHPNAWQLLQNNRHAQFWMKAGRPGKYLPWRAIGFQLNGSIKQWDHNYGSRTFDGTQSTLFASFLYNTIVKDTDRPVKLGVQMRINHINESLSVGTFPSDRTEYIPGVYSEFTTPIGEKTISVLGIRADYNSIYGAFVTPRLHIKHDFSTSSFLRFGTGLGRRAPYVFLDNENIFYSNRVFQFNSNPNLGDLPYGLEMEKAWNSGASYTKSWEIGRSELMLNVDYYYTVFQRQIVYDFDANYRFVTISNRSNDSRAHTLQVRGDLTLAKGIKLRAAYRYMNNSTILDGERRLLPFLPEHKGFVNVEWVFHENWSWDATWHGIGKQRIPKSINSPSESYSPAYSLINTQISFTARPNFTLYAGGENLLNFRQDNPIILSGSTSLDGFDASLIWAPIFGRNIYVGLRWSIY